MGNNLVKLRYNSEKSLNNSTPKAFSGKTHGGERQIERKNLGLIMLSVVAVAAIVSGILITTQAYNPQVSAADNEQTTDQTSVTTTTDSTNYSAAPQWFCMGIEQGRHGGRGPFGMGLGTGMGQYGGIEVSSEFQDNVVNIAKADSDVQQLLSDGYNVTRVVPTIKTVLNGDGNVVTQATNATVLLTKDTTGRAIVSIDLEQSKVTQITILTRTVIEKP